MTTKRRSANPMFKNTPTKESITGIAKPQRGTLIRCHLCGKSGGTLVKVGDHYEHQNKCK